MWLCICKFGWCCRCVRVADACVRSLCIAGPMSNTLLAVCPSGRLTRVVGQSRRHFHFKSAPRRPQDDPRPSVRTARRRIHASEVDLSSSSSTNVEAHLLQLDGVSMREVQRQRLSGSFLIPLTANCSRCLCRQWRSLTLWQLAFPSSGEIPTNCCTRSSPKSRFEKASNLLLPKVVLIPKAYVYYKEVILERTEADHFDVLQRYLP